jgi:predicted metal-dependent hydrolase
MRKLILKTASGPLEYTVNYRPRLKKRLHMEKDENGGLVIGAPVHWSSRQIDMMLAQNSSRVERFLARAQAQKLEPLQYTQSERHRYLGIRYPLAIKVAPDRHPGVVLEEDEFRVDIRHDTTDDIRKVLQAWYCQQATRVFGERLQCIKPRAAWTKGKSIPLKVRRMKRTWGNCSSKGIIKLNTHLIKAPLSLIDSVIAHELCHLQEMNHGKAFYALLDSLNPNWWRDRMILRSEGNIYLL